MKDLRADWHRWTRVERIAAILIALTTSGAVPVVVLLTFQG